MIARTAGGPFSPNRPNQRLNHRHYSPEVLTIAVSDSTATHSFEEAAKLLSISSELNISPRHLQTLCQEVGGELKAERREKTTAYQERPLMTPPALAEPPIPLATVMIDYERASVLVTSNLPFSEWNQIFQGERMTAALLDRLTHHCHIFEMNGESYRFRESMKSKKGRKPE